MPDRFRYGPVAGYHKNGPKTFYERISTVTNVLGQHMGNTHGNCGIAYIASMFDVRRSIAFDCVGSHCRSHPALLPPMPLPGRQTQKLTSCTKFKANGDAAWRIGLGAAHHALRCFTHSDRPTAVSAMQVCGCAWCVCI